MEIIVEGISEKLVTPNQVTINLNFNYKNENYEELIKEAISEINDFIKEILNKYNLKNTDLKTTNFIIKKENKYNEKTNTYEFDTYSYNQSANITFMYDNTTLPNIINDISKLSNVPTYSVTFDIQDKEKYKRKLIQEAFEDAKEKAEVISLSANKTLKECIKTDFREVSDFYREALFNDNIMEARMLNLSKQIFENITPEDIKLTEKIYSIWIAE